MDAERYLERIGYRGSPKPTAEVLAELHRAHLRAVPFENLDIPLGRPIELSLEALFEKVVGRRRGGFCYELNALFAWLLAELGFRVEMLSGRVFGERGPGPEFDHMLLRVEAGESWIADVGFGDSFHVPLRLGTQEAREGRRRYRIRPEGESLLLERRDAGSAEWEPQYLFGLRPQRLEDFEPMCRYHQISPESTFTRKVLCTLARPEGRATLADGRLILTDAGGRRERVIDDAREVRALLGRLFGVELPLAEVRRLLE